MTRSYRKNIVRTFKSARSRFAAIFSIVALGVGFLAGLNATPIDMEESMEKYMDDGNFYDLRIVSTMGLTDEDVSALEQVDGVAQVQPGYSADLLVEAGEDVVVSRLLSVPPEDEDAINKLTLVEGRLPETSGECVVEAGATLGGSAYPVGTKLTVNSSDNEDLDTKLACTEYTVVGVVHNTNYFSFEREPASVGNGTVELVMYLLPQDFAYDTYTEIYVTADGALAQNSMVDEYEATVEAVQTKVEEIQDERCQARYDEIRSEAQEEIDDAWAEYYDAEEEANRELADAAQELADGRQELADGEQEYLDGEQEYADGLQELTDNEAKVNDGAVQLADGIQELLDSQAKVEEGEAELAANEPQLAEARRKLESGQADYEAGLQQYNDALAQLEEGEQQLADGKVQLDAAEQQYTEGVEELVVQINGMLQSGTAETAVGLTPEQMAGLLTPSTPETAAGQAEGAAAVYGQSTAESASRGLTIEQILSLLQTNTPDTSGVTLTTEDVEGVVAWMIENEYPNPTSYDELLDRAEAYMRECYGEEAGPFPLTSTARTVQEQAGKMLYALQMLPGDPTQQQLELAAQLTAICEADRADMQSVLQSSQEWLAAQEEQETMTRLFGMMVPVWLQYLLAEQAQTEPLVTGFATMVDGRRTLDASWQAYYENAQKLADGRKQLEDSTALLDDAKRQLDDGWAQYNAGLAEYEAGKRELESARNQIADGWATLTDKQLELDDARRQINDAKAELADARAELDEARRTIEENTQKLRDGEIEYEDAKAEAEQELADARAEIEDAQKEVDDIEFPEWYVWDRSNNVSYASFTGNVDKLTAITTIFPVFFFLVAALVVSTTMTRMVEEERLQIGTMKALGYTKNAIMQKYLLYALTAAAAGALFGLCVGFFVFPRVIWTAYQMMYWTPTFYTPWRWDICVLSAGSLLLCTLAATWSACRATLHETPAALMRPRAPKAGKRILLERVGFLWRRMPFTYKVTCRNLFRYKRRFWMTVIGVAGCTALLVTGFGISDSLNSIATKQFGEIYNYDLLTAVTDPEYTQQGPVYDILFGDEDDGAVDASMTVYTKQVEQELEDGGTLDFYFMIPQDVEGFGDFADLHNRQTGQPTPLQQEGVVLTEKMASTLGVQVGDTVTLDDGDGNLATFQVSGICEHYVYNYVYMSAASYTEGFGAEPEWNAVMTRLTDDSEAARSDLSARLLELDEVGSLSFTADTEAMVLNMLESIDAVVVLIIVCAASLAFVVLYNLTNINIAERVKEIATIKVLGFYDREVDAYVNRESVALTLIGALFGLTGGVALHRFVILTVEVDAVMFGRSIQPLSFVYALALTILFSTVVNLVMGRRLKHISMVESMKAPE